MNGEPDNYNVPTWKFVAALVVIVLIMFLATLFWMWRDRTPRHRPALLGSPQSAIVATNQASVRPSP
jgi:uncharacterized BrkB/YihY/UPF0761 family membrane protein